MSQLIVFLGVLSVKHLEFLHNVLNMMEFKRLLFKARRFLLVCFAAGCMIRASYYAVTVKEVSVGTL